MLMKMRRNSDRYSEVDRSESGCCRDSSGGSIFYNILGLFFVAALPAGFWVGFAFFIGYLFDLKLDLLMLSGFGLCVFAFLALVYSFFVEYPSR